MCRFSRSAFVECQRVHEVNRSQRPVAVVQRAGSHRDMEPHHPNARRNIEQAERLLEALERRKAR